MAQSTTSAALLGLSASATSTIATSTLPKAITPATTQLPAENYEAITIGFKRGLNYPFVVLHPVLLAQIMEYLPLVLGYPYGLSSDSNIYVLQIVPFQSSAVDYLITVAQVYFPLDKILELQNLVSDASSSLYTNPDDTERMLALLIDPLVPLTGVLTSTQVAGNQPTSTGTPEYGLMDVTLYGLLALSDSTPLLRGRVAGIAILSVVGCSMYILLMFVLVRRYKLGKLRLGLVLPVLGDLSDDTSSVELVDARYASGGGGAYDFAANYNNVPFTPHGGEPLMQSVSPAAAVVPRISEPMNPKNSLGW